MFSFNMPFKTAHSSEFFFTKRTFFRLSSIYFIFIWIRGTWPRLRIDQMLDFNWKFMVPLTLVMLFTVAILDKLKSASLTVLSLVNKIFSGAKLPIEYGKISGKTPVWKGNWSC